MGRFAAVMLNMKNMGGNENLTYQLISSAVRAATQEQIEAHPERESLFVVGKNCFGGRGTAGFGYF